MTNTSYNTETIPDQAYILAYEKDAEKFKKKAMTKSIEVLERYQRIIEPKNSLEYFCQIFHPDWMMKQIETEAIIQEKKHQKNLESKLK